MNDQGIILAELTAIERELTAKCKWIDKGIRENPELRKDEEVLLQQRIWKAQLLKARQEIRQIRSS